MNDRLQLIKGFTTIGVAESAKINGKEQLILGDYEKDLIFRTKGTITVQVGNKFINLLGAEGTNSSIINGATVTITEDINSVSTNPGDLVFDSNSKILYVNVAGVLVPINNSVGQIISGAFLSYNEVQDLSPGQRDLALSNLGYVIPNLEATKNSNLVYSVADAQHYYNLNGEWVPLYITTHGGLIDGTLSFHKQGDTSLYIWGNQADTDPVKKGIKLEDDLGSLTIYNTTTAANIKSDKLLNLNDSIFLENGRVGIGGRNETPLSTTYLANNTFADEITVGDLIESENFESVSKFFINPPQGFGLINTDNGWQLQVDDLIVKNLQQEFKLKSTNKQEYLTKSYFVKSIYNDSIYGNVVSLNTHVGIITGDRLLGVDYDENDKVLYRVSVLVTNIIETVEEGETITKVIVDSIPRSWRTNQELVLIKKEGVLIDSFKRNIVAYNNVTSFADLSVNAEGTGEEWVDITRPYPVEQNTVIGYLGDVVDSEFNIEGFGLYSKNSYLRGQANLNYLKLGSELEFKDGVLTMAQLANKDKWDQAYAWGNHAGLYASRATLSPSGLNSVRSMDTRATNPLPTANLRAGIIFDFKQTSTIGFNTLAGASTYASTYTFASYHDDSGNNNSAYQLAQSGGTLGFRTYLTGAWQPWRRVWTSADFDLTKLVTTDTEQTISGYKSYTGASEDRFAIAFGKIKNLKSVIGANGAIQSIKICLGSSLVATMWEAVVDIYKYVANSNTFSTYPETTEVRITGYNSTAGGALYNSSVKVNGEPSTVTSVDWYRDANNLIYIVIKGSFASYPKVVLRELNLHHSLTQAIVNAIKAGVTMELSTDVTGLTLLRSVTGANINYTATQLYVTNAIAAIPLSPLISINEGNGIGYRLKDINAANAGNIGRYSVDFGEYTAASTTKGATGEGSVAFGKDNTAGAIRSFVMGTNNEIPAGSSNITAFGENNYARGSAGFVAGSNNRLESTNSFMTGYNNKQSTGGNNLIAGNDNIAEGSGNLQVGYQNTTDGGTAYSIIAGQNNKIIQGSVSSLVLGTGNTISQSASNSIVGGQANKLEGSAGNNIVTGAANQLTNSAQFNIVTGQNNMLSNGSTFNIVNGATITMVDKNGKVCQFNLITGNTNQINGTSKSLIGGNNNIANNADNSLIIGDNNIGNSPSQIITGSYNEDVVTNITDTRRIFVIGNGTSTTRKDSLYVQANGLLVTTNDIEIKDLTKGVIFTSPDASRWRVTMSDTGEFIKTKLT